MDKKINTILKNGSSSPEDLLLLAKKLKLKIKYIGSIYNLTNLNPGNYILLITPNESITTGHWTCMKIEKNQAFYHDSFGVGPPTIITDNIKVPIIFNDKQIQALNQEHCGLYCLDFLFNINKKGNSKTNYNNFIKKFDIYNS